MRAFVFTDRALAKHAGQFVWLSVDTENAKNAAFIEKYPVKAWPSFYVIDPATEKVALRWVGGATVPQLEKLFADGERAVGGAGRPTTETASRRAAEAVSRADALYGKGDYAGAGKAYSEAMKLLTPRSRDYARVVESLLFCHAVDHEPAACVALARDAMPHLRHSASAANVAASGLDCALKLPENAPGRARDLAAFEADVRAVLSDPKLALPADDRSALYGTLFDAREASKDEAGAKEVAAKWIADLDAAAARAKTPEERTALDPNRLSAYLAAGEPQKAIPMLEQSARDFPDDYNPPARLAYVYLQLKQYDRALAASTQALEKVYGPRKLRVLSERASIYNGMGDAAAAKKTLEEAVAYAEALPAGQRSSATIASLKKRLAEP
jgi:predicted negative regulator of RcsB-dependent stress response